MLCWGEIYGPKYLETPAWRNLHTKVMVLKIDRCSTGSQWRSFRTGEILEYLLVLDTIHAAQFCIHCNLRRLYFDTLLNYWVAIVKVTTDKCIGHKNSNIRGKISTNPSEISIQCKISVFSLYICYHTGNKTLPPLAIAAMHEVSFPPLVLPI